MERSISELTYKGTIPQAILESKKQKKLFVVYISGEDAESAELEKAAWTDSKVVESLSKYCILLHIQHGTADAANFAAIYPQKSVPSITVIGFNGIQLWQSEGFVTADVLASSLEKAWLSLHIQETTASVLTAALASKKPEQSTSGSPGLDSLKQDNSSGAHEPSSLRERHVESKEAKPLAEKRIGHEDPAEDKVINLQEVPSLKSFDADKSSSVEHEQFTSPSDAKKLASTSMVGPDNSMIDHITSGAEESSPSEENITIHHDSGVPEGVLRSTTESTEATVDEKAEPSDGKTVSLDNEKRANISTDIHLNIRLPNGVSLQEKFSISSSLGMVKDYVDKNQGSGIGSYNLAIPYPRKVFSDQDLSKLLSELGLFNRQALIVVPHQRSTSYSRGRSSTSDQTTTADNVSANVSGGGYWGYLRRALSYVNPFSYLGGNPSSSGAEQAQSGMWEYGPNPALQNNLARTERPSSSNLPSQNTHAAGQNDGNSKKPNTSRFGSNIHTLKHDEDDDRFNDRNSFWNGNSTQYGGNNDGR